MNDRATPRNESAPRTLRTACLLLGVALVAYAASDHPFYGDAPGFGKLQAIILGLGVVVGLMAWMPRAIAARVLAVTVSGLVALLVGEVASEVLLSNRIRRSFVSDPDVIFKLAPGRTSESRLTAINGGHLVVQHVNSDGFRGPELLPVGTKTRVIVYGDSFIHAFYSRLEETFPRQLEQRLKTELGAPVEVINAGVSSYGPDQALVRMQADIPALQPDLIVFSVFAGNDYGDLLRNKMFRLDGDGQLQANPWSLSEELVIKFQMNERESLLRRAVRDRLAQRTLAARQSDPDDALGGFLATCLAKAEHEYQDFVLDGSDVVTNATQDFFSADVSLEPRGEAALYRAKLMDAVLRRVHTVATESNVPIVFMFIPHPLDSCGQFLGGTVDNSTYPDYDAENQISPLIETAQSMNAPFLDLLSIFRGDDAERLYLQGGDDHWNGTGQALAAERMAAFLIKNELVPH